MHWPPPPSGPEFNNSVTHPWNNRKVELAKAIRWRRRPAVRVDRENAVKVIDGCIAQSAITINVERAVDRINVGSYSFALCPRLEIRIIVRSPYLVVMGVVANIRPIQTKGWPFNVAPKVQDWWGVYNDLTINGAVEDGLLIQ